MASTSDNPIVPGKDPANDGNVAGLLQFAFKKMMQKVDGMLPARVVSYDKNTRMAVVQPEIMILATNGTGLSRAPLASIRVVSMSDGTTFMHFPIRPGTKGWIEAADRDTSLYFQSATNQEAKPNTARMHSFADGRFIPDIFGSLVFPESANPDTDLIIGTVDGATSIALGPNGVSVVTDKALNAKAATAKIDCPDIEVTGTVKITGSLVVNGVTFETHVHKVTAVNAPTLQPENG